MLCSIYWTFRALLRGSINATSRMSRAAILIRLLDFAKEAATSDSRLSNWSIRRENNPCSAYDPDVASNRPEKAVKDIALRRLVENSSTEARLHDDWTGAERCRSTLRCEAFEPPRFGDHLAESP